MFTHPLAWLEKRWSRQGAAVGGRWRKRAALSGCLLAWIIGDPACAESLSEYSVKAGFLYNFAQFTEWPAEAQANGIFKLCIMGADPFGEALATIQGKLLRSATVEVQSEVDLTTAKQCHLLFINEPDGVRLGNIVRRLGNLPVLTVAQHDDFLRVGGMIQLTMEQNRVRFSINLAAARQARLKLSSHMLRLALKVEGVDE